MTPAVLVVDDSLTVRMDLVEAFEAAGMRTVPCATLREARDALARHTVDAIVLDLLLPDGEGLELVRELRAAPRTASVPVLMLSGEAEIRDRLRAKETGADEYVGKPYDTRYVVAKVRELVGTRRSAPGVRAPVLVIDDSATFRQALRAALEGAGYDVMLAVSGEDGLRTAAGTRPRAIVVDGAMPGMDGASVIRHVRLDAALRNVPCLLLTGSLDAGAELRALDAGADAFARKEQDVGIVLAKLAAMLRAGAQTDLAGERPSLLGPKRILAVDDSPTYLEMLGEALRTDGYDVVLARSGEEALELLAVQPVDCILLDLLMPGLGGHETCRRIKAAPVVRDIPLVMLTALEDREAMLQGFGAGADDYISKAAELDVLRARVRAQIRRKLFEDENRRIREDLLRAELDAAEARAQRELAATRAELVDELERKNAELEAFSYSVSHDLRAPLRAIDGFSQALLEDCGPTLAAEHLDHLHRVRAAVRRMGELIDDLLELSRVGRAEIVRRAVSLSDLARSVVDELVAREPTRNVRVEIEDGLVAACDAQLVRIALENLLGNAWKFTARTPGATVAFGAEPGGTTPVFFVHDDGAGFAMEHAAQLFRPFSRLHAARDFPGTGIGLATVHRIVTRHGGRVWAEAEVGRGATFRFTLPPGADRPRHGSTASDDERP